MESDRYTALCKVIWYCDGQSIVDHFIITDVANYNSAMEKLSKYVGDENIESVTITFMADSYYSISKELYEKEYKDTVGDN